ncbi:arginine deiminase [Entomospira nematocerorum]|uniref:Arginine deiminase n=1 Tax=Entomospira nematocerorum TaxID=2719987 RepID=A0A968GDW6_9SPIO|nr:arginine deiminase [Entomospira nematocera]NIZ47469.1 arginine deiminase [Entomospira nematocera]WDI33991.1 arginine deiminase [Entomospira nematocera]
MRAGVDNAKIQVFSEIGRLKEVLLHRPGLELENFTPEYLREFLFDDILYLEIAQQEHDTFCAVLQKAGVDVRYVETLMTQAMHHNQDAGKMFINQYLVESGVMSEKMRAFVQDWLYDSFSEQDIVNRVIAGIRSRELPTTHTQSLSAMVSKSYPFITKPIPNLLFMRDPFCSVGNGVILSSMKNAIRRREALMLDFIFKNHPDYVNADIPRWFDYTNPTSLEGGDILIINHETLFIGISERTDAYSVEVLAENLFKNSSNTIKKIVAFVIAKKRAFMHLDTVFTQIDHDKFTIHASIEDKLTLYTITPSGVGKSLHITQEQKSLEEILVKILDRNVTLLRCGNGDTIAGDREQWNDGANTLAIAPGEVCVYQRNRVTNQLLEDNGIKVHMLPSSELSRGRGGPRCMSMPLRREIL